MSKWPLGPSTGVSHGPGQDETLWDPAQTNTRENPVKQLPSAAEQSHQVVWRINVCAGICQCPANVADTLVRFNEMRCGWVRGRHILMFSLLTQGLSVSTRGDCVYQSKKQPRLSLCHICICICHTPHVFTWKANLKNSHQTDPIQKANHKT